VPFDAKTYWEDRLRDDYSLHGVGRLNWGIQWNRWMYRVRRHVFLRLVRGLSQSLSAARVLDVGSGTGFYIERWRELGVSEITGSDITEVAVTQLRKSFPDNRFFRMNIGEDIAPIESDRFDFVTCMDVMIHIVDDTLYQNALTNMCALLEPGGHLIFSDLFLHAPARRFEYIVHRPLEMVEDACRRAGFEIVQRRPMFVLMNEPVDSKNGLLKFEYSLLGRIIRRFPSLGSPAGAVMYPLEIFLTTTFRESPATEIMVCRKPS
jgi:2-polyprenyl-3-methyl-5-hydroxy-6-metoxy-1,4-benzoquinol methylase